MNTEIKLFTSPTGTELRTVEKDGIIYFVGKDVATMLGYTNPQKAVRDLQKASRGGNTRAV